MLQSISNTGTYSTHMSIVAMVLGAPSKSSITPDKVPSHSSAPKGAVCRSV
jgi:hypothetical protein